MAERTIFARKATGLVREIGFTVAVMIPIANAVGVGWQLRVFQGMGFAPVNRADWFMGIPPVTMAFLLTGIGVLLSVYCYAVLTAAMPRSGGGYIAISRVLSPLWGMLATVFEFLAVSASYGQIAVFVIEAFLIFGALGAVGLVLPAFFSGPVGLWILGLLIIILFSGIAARGARQTGQLLQITFWIPAAILAYVLFLFLTASSGAMQAGVEAEFGASATAYVEQALATGIAENSVPYWAGVTTAIFVTYWAYIGYATTSFVAGEVKEAGRRLPTIMFTAAGIIIGLYLVVSFLLARAGAAAATVGGYDLVGAVGYMNFGAGSFGDLSGIGPWMPMFAYLNVAHTGLASITGWLVLLFAALWAANDIPPFILTTSRVLFAMAFDRVLPERIADVNERWHSPVNAIIVTSAVALLGAATEAGLFREGGIYLGSVFESLIDGFGLSAVNAWDSLFFTSFAIALIAFPIRRPDLFERAPFRHSREVTIGIGVVAGAVNLYFFYLFALHPTVRGGELQALGLLTDFSLEKAMPTLVTLAIAIGVVAIYYYYKGRAAETGADYSTIFAEIPPE